MVLDMVFDVYLGYSRRQCFSFVSLGFSRETFYREGRSRFDFVYQFVFKKGWCAQRKLSLITRTCTELHIDDLKIRLH